MVGGGAGPVCWATDTADADCVTTTVWPGAILVTTEGVAADEAAEDVGDPVDEGADDEAAVLAAELEPEPL